MPHPAADRNLLFGILALQMDFIRRDALVKAMHAWVLDKAKPLGRSSWNRAPSTEDAMPCWTPGPKAPRMHGGDAGEESGGRQLRSARARELQQIADPDLQASLSRSVRPTIPCHATRPGGDRVGPRFRFCGRTPSGGLGDVFVARTGNCTARWRLKEIQQRHADHPESRARFWSRRRSPAGWSIQALCRSIAWASTPTAGPSTPCVHQG